MYRTRTWPGFSRVGGRAGVSNEAVEGVEEGGQRLATPRRRVDQRVLAARDRRPALGLSLGRGLEARGEPLADGRAERRERIRAGERGHGTCQYRFLPPNRPDVLSRRGRRHRSWPRRPQSRPQARHLVSTTGRNGSRGGRAALRNPMSMRSTFAEGSAALQSRWSTAATLVTSRPSEWRIGRCRRPLREITARQRGVRGEMSRRSRHLARPLGVMVR